MVLSFEDLEKEVESRTTKAVIFDVDGTIYSLVRMRFFMAVDLIASLAFRPWRWNDVAILYFFRKNREMLARSLSEDISTKQYSFYFRGKKSNPEYVELLVRKWIYSRPLRYIRICAYAEVVRLIRRISEQGAKIAYFSDYPPQEKVNQLGLPCDCFVASSDADIDKLKPNKRGLEKIMGELNLSARDCIFVGNDKRKDGLSAKLAGMRFLLLKNGVILREDGDCAFSGHLL